MMSYISVVGIDSAFLGACDDTDDWGGACEDTDDWGGACDDHTDDCGACDDTDDCGECDDTDDWGGARVTASASAPRVSVVRTVLFSEEIQAAVLPWCSREMPV